MKSPHGKATYKRRTMGECINALLWQWELHQIGLRGQQKIRSLLGLFALANNILQGHRLMQSAA